MTTVKSLADLDGLEMPAHVVWIVDGDDAYLAGAGALLREARGRRDKTVLFGPEGDAAVARLRHLADATTDPLVTVLGGGSLVPETMFTMFAAQAEAARAEEFAGLTVVADMDWLLPAGLSTDEIVGFEIQLDRVVHDLGASVVCAYRTKSFETDAIAATCSVHPVEVGAAAPAQFRLIAGDGVWHLSGEIDIAVAGAFEAALGGVLRGGRCVVDVSGVEFIDAGGLRTLVRAATGITIELRGARPIVRRAWNASGFEGEVSSVRLVG